MMTKEPAALLLIFALSLAACASGRDGGRSPLLDDRGSRPVAGERGWNFERTWSLDLDGQGDRERVVLLADVERSGDRLVWEDMHRWVAYVEEPGGRRTYIYDRRIPAGRLDLFTTRPAEGSPRILLLERAGARLGLWEVRYRGRGDVRVEELALRDLDPTTFVGGTAVGDVR